MLRLDSEGGGYESDGGTPEIDHCEFGNIQTENSLLQRAGAKSKGRKDARFGQRIDKLYSSCSTIAHSYAKELS